MRTSAGRRFSRIADALVKEFPGASPVLLRELAGLKFTLEETQAAVIGGDDRAPAATVIIPPRATAVVSEVSAAGTPTPRDRHIEMIAAKGRLGWQKAVGYGRRSLVETGMLRYKTIIGRTLRARTLPAQKVEARVGCKVLNRMTALGMPVSRRLA